MACTNRFGWPGCQWGRGPDWATTGVIRPVTEITRSIVIAIDDFTGLRAHQLLVDPVLADQTAWPTVRCGATVVDLAGGEPAIRNRQNAAAAGCLVDQLRPDRPDRSVRNRPPKRPPTDALLHGMHVEILDHDVAIVARQLGRELVSGVSPQLYAPTVEARKLGFRLLPSS
jgi:hypothetical protein